MSEWKSALILKTTSHNTYVKEKASPATWRNAKLMDFREKKEQFSDFERRVKLPTFSLSYNYDLAKDSSSSIISLKEKAGGIEKSSKSPKLLPSPTDLFPLIILSGILFLCSAGWATAPGQDRTCTCFHRQH